MFDQKIGYILYVQNNSPERSDYNDLARKKISVLSIYSQNTKSVPLPLLYSVVIYCTLFCFSVARSNLSANIAAFVFEMICFNKVSVFR